MLLFLLILPICYLYEEDFYYKYTKEKAIYIIKKYGFNAGGGYPETWIRDFNTFIELTLDSLEKDTIKNNLTVFFAFQTEDRGWSIIDGFVPKEKIYPGPKWVYSKFYPQFAGFKNTVEIDQETSLVQAVWKYINKTGDWTILDVEFDNIKNRLEYSLNYLLENNYEKYYGLLYSATRADWGDIQPEDNPGSWISNKTHYSLSVYDNAMFIEAVEKIIDLIPEKREYWEEIHSNFTKNLKLFMWDSKNQKFIPHIYLKDSPFPPSFNENEIFYMGSTGIALNLLNSDELTNSINQIKNNVYKCKASSIGLTLCPSYPKHYFKNPRMSPYSYQNGGDWSWFGGRIIQSLVKLGFINLAKELLHPMVERVFMFGDFWEWYTRENDPQGSSKFKGSAGVLYKSILMIEEHENKKQ